MSLPTTCKKPIKSVVWQWEHTADMCCAILTDQWYSNDPSDSHRGYPLSYRQPTPCSGCSGQPWHILSSKELAATN